MAVSKRESVIRTWVDNFLWTSISYVASGVSALTACLLAQRFGYYVIFVPVGMMMLIFLFYRSYFTKVENANKRADSFEELNFRTIETIIASIGAVGYATKMNVRRVEHLAIDLAKASGCSQAEIKALRLAAALHDIGNIALSVNLSAKQLAQPDLVERIKQVLEETGLDPRSLKLEITESVIMNNPESTATVLLQLKALGVQLQIDDFGTGYSSLSYLRQFSVDTLKIDQSFVGNMSVDPKNLEIVNTIVMLAHNLGMTVTAEGVETVEQLAQLRSLRCEQGQGYLFSKPIDSKAAKALIMSQMQIYRNPDHLISQSRGDQPCPPALRAQSAPVIN